MNDFNERDILRQMRTVTCLNPSPRRTAQILAAARREQQRRKWVRWTTVSGAAAAIIVGLILGLLTPSQPRATAAEALAHAADTSKGFKGWVQYRFSNEGAADYSITHENTETGEWISESHFDGVLDVMRFVPAEKKEVTYTAKTNQITIGDLSDDFAANWKKNIQEDALRLASAAVTISGVTVHQSTDAGLSRFDFTFPLGSTPPQGSTEQPQSAVVWADPTTDLVQKSQCKFADGRTELTAYTYGVPVANVFDLGVPHDAKVVDLRPTPELKAVMARVEKHYEAGFGDFVAVETETDTVTGGGLDTEGGAVSLYAQSGRLLLSNRYLVGRPGRPPRPAGWPTPTLQAVLATVKPMLPAEFFGGNGTDFWNGWKFPGQKIESSTMTQSEAIAIKPMKTLPGHLWLTRRKLGIFGTTLKVELIHDHPADSLVGIRTGPSGDFHLFGDVDNPIGTNTYWINTAMDDTMGSASTQGFMKERGDKFTTILQNMETKAYSKTADGKSYPSTWQVTDTQITSDGIQKPSTPDEYHLQVWTGQSLTPEWFTNPAKASAPATQP